MVRRPPISTRTVTLFPCTTLFRSVYGQLEAELVPTLRLQAGVRCEDGLQSVTPIDLFGLGGADIVSTKVENIYWLPAATLTWNFAEDMPFRQIGRAHV